MRVNFSQHLKMKKKTSNKVLTKKLGRAKYTTNEEEEQQQQQRWRWWWRRGRDGGGGVNGEGSTILLKSITNKGENTRS